MSNTGSSEPKILAFEWATSDPAFDRNVEQDYAIALHGGGTGRGEPPFNAVRDWKLLLTMAPSETVLWHPTIGLSSDDYMTFELWEALAEKVPGSGSDYGVKLDGLTYVEDQEVSLNPTIPVKVLMQWTVLSGKEFDVHRATLDTDADAPGDSDYQEQVAQPSDIHDARSDGENDAIESMEDAESL